MLIKAHYTFKIQFYCRKGLVKKKTEYMKTKITVNDRYCLHVKPVSKWIPICSKEDKECEGTTNCNEIECKISGKFYQQPFQEP